MSDYLLFSITGNEARLAWLARIAWNYLDLAIQYRNRGERLMMRWAALQYRRQLRVLTAPY